MAYAKVLLETKSPGIANGLTYGTQQLSVEPGSLVTVPIRGKTTPGIVVEFTKHTADFAVKDIRTTLQQSPLLPKHALETAQWMADYYACNIRQAISPFLPGKKWLDLLPKVETFVRLLEHEVRLPGKRQQEVLDYLQDEDWVRLSTLRSDIQTPLSTLRTLERQGLLVLEERVQKYPQAKKFVEHPTLTAAQKVAYETIRQSTKPALLFGVTGSGKTEIYAKYIAEAVQEGKQAIVLVPEILLTEHTVQRFYTMLAPERIAVVHSRLTLTERTSIWRQCRAGAIDLVIGSRSALFSPLENLGLVVIDEEHEWTYKNEQTPRYHARETAEALCAFAGARLILGSATPSIESWSRAKNGQYTLARLQERYLQQPMPDVSIVDLAEIYFQDNYPLSPSLQAMIQETLDAKEQCVLFLNRRGHSSALLCMDCRRRVVSPHSQLPFTVHLRPDGKQELVDHTTNTRVDVPARCPHCQSVQLIQIGAGTQKIEQVLKHTFPQARVLRADSDTMQHPEDMRNLLKTMKEGQADILLGTQTVAKGLDLPSVTLAAVLVADVGMSLPHFRAGERVFQMLIQLTGRSGRSKPGRVVLQTFRPDCAEVQLAASHSTEEYLNKELKLREALGYPPYSKMLRLLCRGPSAAAHAKKLEEICTVHTVDCAVSAAPTIFGGGKVWQVLLRGENPAAVLPHIPHELCTVDVDPIECV